MIPPEASRAVRALCRLVRPFKLGAVPRAAPIGRERGRGVDVELVECAVGVGAAPPPEFKDLFASLGAPFPILHGGSGRLLRDHNWDGEAIEFDEIGRRLGIEFPRAGLVVIARRQL